MDTKTIENIGLKVLKEKPEEITKDVFFKMLVKSKNGLNLKVARIGNTYKSKYKNKDGNSKLGFFIDYEFEYGNKNYMVGINYNVGTETKPETFVLTSQMNLFKILSITTDLSRADEIEVTKKFIEDQLTGIKFRAETDTAFNGVFIIKPVELLD